MNDSEKIESFERDHYKLEARVDVIEKRIESFESQINSKLSELLHFQKTAHAEINELKNSIERNKNIYEGKRQIIMMLIKFIPLFIIAMIIVDKLDIHNLLEKVF